MPARLRPSGSAALVAARGSWRVGSAVARAWRLAFGLAVAAAWPGTARAEPPEDPPWARGVTSFELDLSPWGLLNEDVTSLSFGLSARRYLVHGLALGLGVSDTLFVYREAFKAHHPGVEAQLPTNMVEVTPLLQYVFFRSRWLSPYVYGGLGPVFFNHGGGVHGQWHGGPGVYVHVRGPIFASLGVGFSGLFPGARCSDALVYQPEGSDAPGIPVDLCSFRWGPQIGVALAFGGRGRGRAQPPRRPAPRGAPLVEPRAADARPPVRGPGPAAPPLPSPAPSGATDTTNPEPLDAPPAPVDRQPPTTDPDDAAGSTDAPRHASGQLASGPWRGPMPRSAELLRLR